MIDETCRAFTTVTVVTGALQGNTAHNWCCELMKCLINFTARQLKKGHSRTFYTYGHPIAEMCKE